mgnify:CR=1 FL=1
MMDTDVLDALREVHDVMELLAEFLMQIHQGSDDPEKIELLQLSTSLRLLALGDTSAMQGFVEASPYQLH